MSKRATLNRIAAVVLTLWGALIVARGLPSGGGAYGAGQRAAYVFGFLMIAGGIWALMRMNGALDAPSGYDDFEGDPPRLPWWAGPVAIGVGSFALVVFAAFALGHLRTYVGEEGEVALSDRCIRGMREEYDRSGSPATQGVPPNAYALLVPKVCALGIERGLVAEDGTMTEQAGRDVTLAVIAEIGAARFQTLVFNELAVSQYHLAKKHEVTRRDRCVAMGYSGWDAQPAKENLPPRDLFFQAVRQMCGAAVKQGLVPPSGAPLPGTAEDAALQKLLRKKLLQLSRTR